MIDLGKHILVIVSSLALLGGCSGKSSGSGSDGGGGGGGTAAGTPGWHVYNSSPSFVVSTGFGTATSGPLVFTGTPDAMDPWYQDFTDRTFDWVQDDGTAHAEAHATFAKSGNVLTITGSASAMGGDIHANGAAGLVGVWCYTPSVSAPSVTFTIDASQSTTPTATGKYGGGAWAFHNWERDCTGTYAIGAGGAGGVTTCTSSTVTVPIYAKQSPAACIPLGGNAADVTWVADGGNGGAGTDGSGSVAAKFVITATPQ